MREERKKTVRSKEVTEKGGGHWMKGGRMRGGVTDEEEMRKET